MYIHICLVLSPAPVLPTESCQTEDQSAATHSDLTHSSKFVDMDTKQQLEKVDERLTCAICLRRYQDPRMLPFLLQRVSY